MSDATVPVVSEIGEVEFRDPFDVVYHREFRSTVRMASALVDSPEQAEEVVQDAFAALYLRYRLVNDPVSYVRMSVLNGCRKVLRRRRIVRRQPPPTAESGELVYNHVLDAVRRLPTRQRNAITLRYELQLSDAEIAETLGMPLGTVKSTLHRALARLRSEVIE